MSVKRIHRLCENGALLLSSGTLDTDRGVVDPGQNRWDQPVTVGASLEFEFDDGSMMSGTVSRVDSEGGSARLFVELKR